VFNDGTNTYLYGFNRISQTNTDTTGSFLDDAIDNVRQVAGLKKNFLCAACPRFIRTASPREIALLWCKDPIQ
jgi:hypothetical protein